MNEELVQQYARLIKHIKDSHPGVDQKAVLRRLSSEAMEKALLCLDQAERYDLARANCERTGFPASANRDKQKAEECRVRASDWLGLI